MHFIVIGAGISGLAAANSLKKKGSNSVVLESCPVEGGLTRTMQVDKFCFDYTGHLLHLSKYKTPSAIPFADLIEEDWQLIARKSFCLIDDQLIKAPIQYNICQLPKDKLSAAVESFNSRLTLPASGDISFRTFLINGFGRYLSNIFLIPQNEKCLSIDVDRLSLSAVKRFFPPPDEQRVLSGMRENEQNPSEYNSNFWYPKQGGIELLVKGLSKNLNQINFQEEVVDIDINARNLVTNKGRAYKWDVLLSSIPLPRLCHISNDPELQKLGSNLTHSATIVFNIGMKSPMPEGFARAHWIYIPDRNIPFYRAGFYSNISAGVCPPDCVSMYVEVGVAGNKLKNVKIAADILPKVLKSLSNLGWINTTAIKCIVSNIIDCAYVHFTPQREQCVKNIVNRLNAFGIYPIGRYGLWDYISMEDSIFSSIETVEKITK